jgi:cold shock protein
MPTGTIARLLIDKGFGFIRDEGGIEHFFHRSSVRGAVFELLREGQRVEFTPEDSQKGPRAGDVRLIEGWHTLHSTGICYRTEGWSRSALGSPLQRCQHPIEIAEILKHNIGAW